MSGRKRKIDGIPYDPITGYILHSEHLPGTWTWDPVIRQNVLILKDEYKDLEIIWKPNIAFHATYRFDGIHSTYSGTGYAQLTDTTTGESFMMYSAEFNEVLNRFTNGPELDGMWVFKRKGGSQFALAGA